jgi:ribonuclease Y
MDALLMQIITLPAVVIPIITFGLGISLAAIVHQMIIRARAKTFEQDMQRQLEGAKREAENIIKSAQIDAAAEAIKKKEQLTAEANQVRAELHETEMRLTKREDALDKQTQLVHQQEDMLKQQEKEIERRSNNVASKEKQLSTLMAQQKNQLLKITAMNIEEAKDLLLMRARNVGSDSAQGRRGNRGCERKKPGDTKHSHSAICR